MTPLICGYHRGFEVGCKPAGIKTYWRSCWREMGAAEWTDGNLLCDDAEDAVRCARECIDYDYRVAVWEFLNGRKYDAMADGCIPSND
jgi:hypothetical protein